MLSLSLEQPGWGRYKLSDYLTFQGIGVSGPTTQNVLATQGLGSKYERPLRPEERALEEGPELTPEQVALVEKADPCYRERHVESSRPGELLCQDTYLVGTFKGVGTVYLHGLVDTYGSYAFGLLYTGRIPEAAVALLHNDVLPFYQERGGPVGAILTDNGRECCGTDTHPFELYLALNDVERRRTKVRSPQTDGFVGRFQGTIRSEFFQVALRQRFYASASTPAPKTSSPISTPGSSITTPSGLIAASATAASARRIRSTAT